MNVRRRIIGVLAALVLGGGAAVAVATPASADPAACGNGQFCISTSVTLNYVNYFWTLNNYASGSCVNIGSPHDNTARAVAEWHFSRSATLHTGSNCTGNTILATNAHIWSTCTNTDYWGGFFGPPALWRTNYSSCVSPTASSFRILGA